MARARSRRRERCGRAPAADLAPQAADVRVDRPLARPVAPAPHLGQQLLAREHGAGAGGEHPQQFELGRRQVLLLAVDGHAARRGIEVQRTVPDRRPAGARAAARRAAAAPARARPAPAARTASSCSRRRRPRARPARPPRRRAPSASAPAPADARCTRRHTSSPSSPGSIRSSTTRSGRTRSHSSTPAGPSRGRLDLEPLGPQPRRHRSRDDILVLDHADQLSPHAAECARAMWTRRAETVQVPCRPCPGGRGYTAGSARM